MSVCPLFALFLGLGRGKEHQIRHVTSGWYCKVMTGPRYGRNLQKRKGWLQRKWSSLESYILGSGEISCLEGIMSYLILKIWIHKAFIPEIYVNVTIWAELHHWHEKKKTEVWTLWDHEQITLFHNYLYRRYAAPPVLVWYGVEEINPDVTTFKKIYRATVWRWRSEWTISWYEKPVIPTLL